MSLLVSPMPGNSFSRKLALQDSISVRVPSSFSPRKTYPLDPFGYRRNMHFLARGPNFPCDEEQSAHKPLNPKSEMPQIRFSPRPKFVWSQLNRLGGDSVQQICGCQQSISPE